MVLESLINPFTAEKRPWEMFFIGIVYSSVAVVLSLWIFRQHASLVMVFLTVLASVPLVYSTMKLEEEKELYIKTEKSLLTEHSKALMFLMLYFFGITISFVAWYVLAPEHIIQTLFRVQSQTIIDINNQVTGNVSSYVQLNWFSKIFFNNLKVLVFCILFSFIYGVGAIFILTWNASVIGTAIGNFIRSNIATTGNYFYVSSLGILRYMIHGIPEILAYFVAGLGGGIISVAIINHDFRKEIMRKILLDSSDLIVIAIGLLLVAALMEVYITPLFF